MKKSIAYLILLSVIGCDEKAEEPTAAAEPAIAFESIHFGRGNPNSIIQDSVSLTINVTDGDGDFGMDPSDFTYQKDPYQKSFFVVKSTGEIVSDRSVMNGTVTMAELLKFSDRANPPYDTLPPLSDCNYYPFFDPDSGTPIPVDHLYYIPNKRHHNLFITVLVDAGDGSFTDATEIFGVCPDNLFTQIPPFAVSPPHKRYISYAMIGTIDIASTVDTESMVKGRYKIDIMTGHWKKLSGRSIKLRVYVQDLALNESNTIDTPVFKVN